MRRTQTAPSGPQRTQTFDSNAPNVKIRGNAYQVFERYIALAREAATSGDRIAAENLYQHAEHYFRIMNANGEGGPHGAPRPTTPADFEMGRSEADGGETNGNPGPAGAPGISARGAAPGRGAYLPARYAAFRLAPSVPDAVPRSVDDRGCPVE